jgi:hypothetical protein
MRYLKSIKYDEIPKYPSQFPLDRAEVFQYNEIEPLSDQSFTVEGDPTTLYISLEDLKYYPDFVHGIEYITYYNVLNKKINKLKSGTRATNRIDPVIAFTENRNNTEEE